HRPIGKALLRPPCPRYGKKRQPRSHDHADAPYLHGGYPALIVSPALSEKAPGFASRMPVIPDLSKRDSGNDVALIPDTASQSRGAMREFCYQRPALPKTEGAGNAGCPPHPQPRVQNVK